MLGMFPSPLRRGSRCVGGLLFLFVLFILTLLLTSLINPAGVDEDGGVIILEEGRRLQAS